jgi:two-component system chemotaxis response regulator CheB
MKILIVDDSALLRNILRQVLHEKSDISVAAEATNGKQAIELCASVAPDLVIMDINMPVMDGITATEEIMKTRPVPVLILSSAVDSASSFRALKSGAVEVMKKPDIDQFNNPAFYGDFIEKIRALAAVRVGRSYAAINDGAGPGTKADYRMIVMGASTGGPLTVCSILEKLPPDYPLGIALVQHLEHGFDKSFAEWLGSETGLKARIAAGGDLPGPGEVHIAPAGRHLLVRNGKLVIDDGPPVLNQKPSVDLLFKTASEMFHSNLLGVLLTGMGADGADGCVEILSRGGVTLVQDKSTSTIFGMPRVAIEKNGATHVLTMSGIADYLLKLADRAG